LPAEPVSFLSILISLRSRTDCIVRSSHVAPNNPWSGLAGHGVRPDGGRCMVSR